MTISVWCFFQFDHFCATQFVAAKPYSILLPSIVGSLKKVREEKVRMASQLTFYLIGFLVLIGSINSTNLDHCDDLQESVKYVLCYVSNTTLSTHLDSCRCTHLIVPFVEASFPAQDNGTVTPDQNTVDILRSSGAVNEGTGLRLRRIVSLQLTTEDFSPNMSFRYIDAIESLIEDFLIEGVEINWHETRADNISKKHKSNLVLFIKEMHAVLQEKVIIVHNNGKGAAASFDANSTLVVDREEIDAIRPSILLRLPTSTESLVKGYDLKPLSKTVDLFVVGTHNITDLSTANSTFHHSRLMGTSDIYNTDSILDLVISLGVPTERMIAAVPSFAIEFRLANATLNTPGSPVTQSPTYISREQVCSRMSSGNWTIERDDDLTGSYAFSDDGDWIAFDDELTAQIKAKYFLLRDIAGVALITVDEMEGSSCDANQEKQSIVKIYYENFFFLESGKRTKRQLLESLEYDLTTSAATQNSFFASDKVRRSPYRVVRVVDRLGETVVIRQTQETSLTCSRQGYYRHPEDCNRFYRCVKFDQYVDDFTVFEYGCPNGLVFDEKYEICTWPSQTAPCGGSSEIKPVPSQKFRCPGEGYFADPENCRWFFACRDYSKDGTFTQYEFRCPFGLVFDEKNLMCNWPWLVPQCGSEGVASIGNAYAASQQTYSRQPTLENQPQPMVSKGISIGSPGYLSGKLVTGEGLYKDPRPAHLSDSVVSSGCIDCHSASLTLIREPVSVTHPPKQYPTPTTYEAPKQQYQPASIPSKTYDTTESYLKQQYQGSYESAPIPTTVKYYEATENYPKKQYQSGYQPTPIPTVVNTYETTESYPKQQYQGSYQAAPIPASAIVASTAPVRVINPGQSDSYTPLTDSSYQAHPSPPSYENRPVSAGEYKYKPIHYPTEIKIAHPYLAPHSIEESSVNGHGSKSHHYSTSSYTPAAEVGYTPLEIQRPTALKDDSLKNVQSQLSNSYEKEPTYPTTAYSKPIQSYTIPKLNIAEYFPEVELAKSPSPSAAKSYGHHLRYEVPSKSTECKEEKRTYEGSTDNYRPQEEYVKPLSSYKPNVAIPYDPMSEKVVPVSVYNVPNTNYNGQKIASLNQDRSSYTDYPIGYAEKERPSYPSVSSYIPEKSNGKQQQAPAISNDEYSVTSHLATPYHQAETEKKTAPSLSNDGKQSYGEVGNVALYYRVDPQPSYPQEQSYYASTENVYTKPEGTTQSFDNTGYLNQDGNVAVFYQVKNIPSSSIEGYQNNYAIVKSSGGKSNPNYEVTEAQAGEIDSYDAARYQPASEDYSQSSQPEMKESYSQSKGATTYDEKPIDSGIENKYNSAIKIVIPSQPAYYPAPVESRPPSYYSGAGKASKGNNYSGSEYTQIKTTTEPYSKYASPSAPSNGDKYTAKPVTPISSSDGSRYGEKIVTVKVPSVNKAALLSKWGPSATSTSDSSENYSNDYAAESKDPSVSYSDVSLSPTYQDNTSKNVQRINAKQPVSISYDGTPSVSQEYGSGVSSSYPQPSQGKLYSNVNSTVANKPKSSNADSGYGQRYLERINKDKARNETLSPDVCVRAGLFRHPSDCQKFYECYWDRWINQYTVHIFKCPVHLVYDEYITACNWPFDGPTCVPHEAIKLYIQTE